MTSLRGPGQRNFNAVSHKQTRAPIQSVPVSFGLWDTALKFLSPGPRNDVTDHLARTTLNLSFIAYSLKIDTPESIIVPFFTTKASSLISVEGGALSR